MSAAVQSESDAIVYVGDCREVLRTFDAESIDAVVTDPPYHLTAMTKRFGAPGSAPAKGPAFQRHNAGFMGKAWDGGDVAHDPATWAEVLRVLKPGGHLIAFGGTRTYHRLACAIEDAGFEVRDCLVWLYGSGFPKSLDVSKRLDKMAGHHRGKAGEPVSANGSMSGPNYARTEKGSAITPAAAAAAGWGTALKPAMEPVCLARKPLSGTVAENWLEHRTGALNIDGCRIHTEGSEAKPYTVTRLKPGATLNRTGGNWRPEQGGVEYHGETTAGRWPANVILDAEAAAMLDEQSGERDSRIGKPRVGRNGDGWGMTATGAEYADSGGASRFFYTAKADSAERSRGLAGRNPHPTVKPVDLMAWLVTLVTPPGGLVLDPFCGSGTTGIAAQGLGMRFVGIEQDRATALDARDRIGMFATLIESPA